MDVPFCSIVIPFRDEENNLEVLLPSLANVISSLNDSIEVILVNDFSQDNSQKTCNDNLNLFQNVQLINLERPSGQSGAFCEAFKLARGVFILRMDADLQDNPNDIPYFIQKFNEGYDLVVGLRECRKHRKLFRIASIIYDLIILILFDTPLHSNSGSFIGFKSALVKNISWKKNDHRYLPLIAYRRGAKKIGEIIVSHSYRIHGKSKYKPFKKLIFGIPEVLLFLRRLYYGHYDKKN